MVTSIQLGNFFNSGGKTVLGGVGGSGLDTEGLVKGLTEAKRLPAVKLEDTVKSNSKRTDALAEFKTLLSAVKDAANFLRNPPGVGNSAQNAFAYTSASVASNTSVSADNYIAVTSSPGVTATSYNISQITSVAAAKKQTTASFVVASADTSVTTTAHTAGFFKAGTVAVDGENITLEVGDSLNEIASKFNAVKANTGIVASVIQAGTNDFRLTFTATATGTAADFNLNTPSSTVPTDADGVLSMIGRTNLLTNGTFDSDITGWMNASLGTGSIAYAAGQISLDGDGAGGNEAFARQSMTTVIGQQYTVRATLADLTSSAFIRIGTNSDVNNVNNYDVANQTVSADGTVSFTFTATATTTYLTLNSDTNTTAVRADDISVVLSSTAAVTNTQTASDAVFVVDGTTITRQNNSISDVYNGITFDLKQATPALTTLTATIAADTTLVKNGIVNFINAYNDLRVFAAKQSEIGANGQYKDTAVLANNTTFRNTISTITNALTQIVSLSDTHTLGNNAFTSTIGANPTVTVNVSNTAQSYVVGQSITIAGASNVNNANINGTWTVASVSGSNVTFVATGKTTTGVAAAGGGAASTLVVSSDDPNRLSEVGITFADLPASKDSPEVRNILDLDEGKLTAALADNFDAFRRVFEFDLQSSNPNLRVFSRTNALSVANFSLSVGTITPPATVPTVTATYNNGRGVETANFDVTAIKDNSTGDTLGYTLKGRDGTAFEGLQLIYASTSAATMTVTTTQGLADKLFNITEGTISNTGALKSEQDSIKTAGERLADQIAKIDEQVERFRQQLLEKFAALEQAISKVNNLLASIDADSQTRFSS